ncbi:MAG: ATP-binding protein [Pseudomonadota bacterium]
MRFFQRIFLSVWVILVITLVLTLFLASLLPYPSDIEDGVHYDEQMVALVAMDLHEHLQTDPNTATLRLVERHVLDFGLLMQIYVIDPAGQDILNRQLPIPVARWLKEQNAGPQCPRDPRLTLAKLALNGYQVIGYQTVFPVGRMLMKPGARFLLILIALLVSVIVSLILARFIVRPIRHLREAGQRVANGDLNVQVAHTVSGRTDDIAQLARDFDVMTGRIQDLLESQQRLMRDVSHELRSPLARLQAMISIARQAPSDNPQLDRMEHELERLNELISKILSFARLEARTEINPQPIELMDLIQTIADDAALEGLDDGKDIQVNGPSQLFMSLDSALMHSALENIVRNALKYTAPQTMVTITVMAKGSAVVINIVDQGPGVPTEDLETLFEPFFRVDEARDTQSGTGGIGLAIAQRSVQLHGGTIQAMNQQPQGLCMEITLP